MLSVLVLYCYAECCYAECRYAECRGTASYIFASFVLHTLRIFANVGGLPQNLIQPLYDHLTIILRYSNNHLFIQLVIIL
jgi:hypothetical protein